MKSSSKRGNLTQTRHFIRPVGTEQSNISIQQTKKKHDGMEGTEKVLLPLK